MRLFVSGNISILLGLSSTSYKRSMPPFLLFPSFHNLLLHSIRKCRISKSGFHLFRSSNSFRSSSINNRFNNSSSILRRSSSTRRSFLTIRCSISFSKILSSVSKNSNSFCYISFLSCFFIVSRSKRSS